MDGPMNPSMPEQRLFDTALRGLETSVQRAGSLVEHGGVVLLEHRCVVQAVGMRTGRAQLAACRSLRRGGDRRCPLTGWGLAQGGVDRTG